MNIYIQSLVAVFIGLKLCLTNAKIFRLALWPWSIGLLSYCICLYVAFSYHSEIMALITSPTTDYWGTIWYYLAWFLVSLALLLVCSSISLVMVMTLGSVFQSSIAREVIQLSTFSVPAEAGVLGELGRSIKIEGLKLLWILPLAIFIFIVALIPILTPLAIALGAWLLGYQFLDTALDIFHLGLRQRIGFALRNGLSVILFGLSLSLLFSIPFLGLFVMPAAVAGAAWLLVHTESGSAELKRYLDKNEP